MRGCEEALSAPVLLFPSHTDADNRQRIQYWMSSDPSWNRRCFMLHYTLLIWPLWKYANNIPQSAGSRAQVRDRRALIGNMADMTVLDTCLKSWNEADGRLPPLFCWRFILRDGGLEVFCSPDKENAQHLDISESRCGRGSGQVSGSGWRAWGDRACVSHTIQAPALHTDTPKQIGNKGPSVLFLFEHEEFSINLLCLVLWSCCTKRDCGWRVSAGLRAAPLGAPRLFSRFQSCCRGMCTSPSRHLIHVNRQTYMLQQQPCKESGPGESKRAVLVSTSWIISCWHQT